MAIFKEKDKDNHVNGLRFRKWYYIRVNSIIMKEVRVYAK